MLHLLLYALLAIVVAVGLFLLASRFLPAGEQIAPALRDEPPWELPAERGLRAEDVDDVRLPVALRGYRFAETDLLLDRLAAELRARDAEIERLRGHAAVPVAPAEEPELPGDEAEPPGDEAEPPAHEAADTEDEVADTELVDDAPAEPAPAEPAPARSARSDDDA